MPLAQLTRAMDEGPIEPVLVQAHGEVEGRLVVGGRAGGLHRPTVGALDALAPASVAGVSAPPTARLVQTLAAGPIARAVFRWSGRVNKGPVKRLGKD